MTTQLEHPKAASPFDDLWDDIELDANAERRRNKREDIAIELNSLLQQAGLCRADLARKLDWKPSRVTRALSGNENLTINTLADIINAVEMDFDIVFRQPSACRHLQDWERKAIDGEVCRLRTDLRKAIVKVDGIHKTAEATLASAQELNRSLFRRGHEMKLATENKRMTPPSPCKVYIYQEDEDAPFHRAA